MSAIMDTDLPPYVTRSTETRVGHLIHDPNWWEAYNALAKFEIGQRVNQQFNKQFNQEQAQ